MSEQPIHRHQQSAKPQTREDYLEAIRRRDPLPPPEKRVIADLSDEESQRFLDVILDA
jgi:hypothetical protein